VDRLSVSYGHRAELTGQRWLGPGWHLLGATMARVERKTARTGAPFAVVACAWPEADELGVGWLPNLVEEPLPPAAHLAPGVDTWDAVFVGTLSYAPNVAAVRALAREIWPEVQAKRPGTTLAIGGWRPTAEVRRLADELGADLLADFDEPVDLYARAKVALSPLPAATGIQYKVLDAASIGLPQVVSPAAVRGFGPGFPLTPSTLGSEFACALLEELEDPAASRERAQVLRSHVLDRYGFDRWAPVAEQLVFGQDGPA